MGSDCGWDSVSEHERNVVDYGVCQIGIVRKLYAVAGIGIGTARCASVGITFVIVLHVVAACRSECVDVMGSSIPDIGQMPRAVVDQDVP